MDIIHLLLLFSFSVSAGLGIYFLVRTVEKLCHTVRSHQQRIDRLESEHNLRQAVYMKILNNQSAMLERIEKMEDPMWLDPISNPHLAKK